MSSFDKEMKRLLNADKAVQERAAVLRSRKPFAPRVDEKPKLTAAFKMILGCLDKMPERRK